MKLIYGNTGGTAGCVLASRLTEDPNISVLVIEAGDDMDNSFVLKTPMTCAALYNSKNDWQLKTVPQIHANGREVDQIRGKMLGGCSGQYTRGPHSDFNKWATVYGNPGWSYEEVLPYFKKSECFHDPRLDRSHERGIKTGRVYLPEFDTFEEDLHGTDGPWHLSFHYLFPCAQGFIRASLAEGVPRLLDPSASPTVGVFRMHCNLDQKGLRSNTSRAFLGPNIVPGGGDRGRVRIILRSYVEKILVEEHNGVKRAIGAEFRDKDDVLRSVRAKREVLVCGGVFHSPTILLASGIGHKIHDSIPLIHPLKGVGENLIDSVSIPIVFKVPSHVKTLMTVFSLKNLIPEIYRYFKDGTGVFSSEIVESGCFLRLDDIAPEFVAREKANGTYIECASGRDAPHIELMFAPVFLKKSADTSLMPPDGGNYYSITPVVLNTASRGKSGAKVVEITAKSGKRLQVQPEIDPNYLANEFDIRVMIEAIKFARKIGKRMQQNPDLAGVEYFPGEKVAPDNDYAAMAEFIRQECYSSLHAVGTSSMGPSSNPDAVVDSKLKVHGINNLRVIDASIFPSIIAGHTAAATVMVAEKASDMIKEEWANK
ncbi:hypothetical protein BGZ76_010629 [Entomortierella beljakovae]|nr:hypothetical protein BGZ76_010629 [Entomortierella beljakovae]